MAKITETTPMPVERTFTLDVNEHELQLIAASLYADDAHGAPNAKLYREVADFMDEHGVDEL